MKRLTLFFLMALSLTLTSHAATDKTLLINIGTNPETLDPALTNGVPEHDVLTAIFEGLTTLDPESMEPIPGVAESWTVSEDGKIYVFKIRKSARWNNGDALTAHDFVYAWNRLLDPKTAAPYASWFYQIEGAKDKNTGVVKGLIRGVKANDDYTLTVRLTAPLPYFLFLTSHYAFTPAHKKTLDKFGDKWTRAENMVSNGPFKLKEQVQNKHIVVEKSSTYWDANSVRLQAIKFLPIENKLTVLNLFKSGKLHYTGHGNLPEARIERLSKMPEYQSPPRLGTYYALINVTKPPFNDVKVRTALAHAIDREIITKHVTKAGEIPTTSLNPVSMPKYDRPEGPEFDPKKAAQLLSEAGFCAPGHQKEGCKEFPAFEVLYNTNERHQLVFQAIQQMWKRHLGIKHVSLVNREWKVFLSEMRALQYSVCRRGWIGDYPDPMAFLELFETGNPSNNSGWSFPPYDKLLAQARLETNTEKRKGILHEAEKIILQELPMIPIYSYTAPALVAKELKGFYPNAMDQHPYKAMYLEK